jgi:hypothetical protein
MHKYLVFAIGLVATGCNPSSPEQPSPAPKASHKHHEPIAPPSEEVAEPEPVAANGFGDGLQLRRPIQDGRLTLIPIVSTNQPAERKFITLQDGMANGLVTVSEHPEGGYSSVAVSNHSNDPLVILGGEVLLDGHQDRMTAANMIVPEHATVRVGTYCVELGRASGAETFHPGNAIAEIALRRIGAHGDQSAVWSFVDEINSREGLAPRTSTYRLAAKAQLKGGNVERRDRILAQLGALEEHDRIVGLAVAIDNRVVAIDRFGTAALYRQLEPLLLASYLPTTSGKARTSAPLTPDSVRAFAGKLVPVKSVETTIR